MCCVKLFQYRYSSPKIFINCRCFIIYSPSSSSWCRNGHTHVFVNCYHHHHHCVFRSLLHQLKTCLFAASSQLLKILLQTYVYFTTNDPCPHSCLHNKISTLSLIFIHLFYRGQMPKDMRSIGGKKQLHKKTRSP